MNVVTSIRGYMLLLNDFEDPAERERIFDTIIGFLKRIENLVNFSREYEQIGVHSPTWQNVAHLIEPFILQWSQGRCAPMVVVLCA